MPERPVRRVRPNRQATDPGGLPDEWGGAESRAYAADPPQTERGLRGLIGGGASQVSTSAAMRARDATRPRPDELERAETQLAIIRRYWIPASTEVRPQ